VMDVELRDRIQRIALRFPAYGRPRITAELQRQGWAANHKRVGRIMREDNLLCLRKRRFQAPRPRDRSDGLPQTRKVLVQKSGHKTSQGHKNRG